MILTNRSKGSGGEGLRKEERKREMEGRRTGIYIG